PKLYKSIIEDVIEGVQHLFAEEGLEEQVLTNLKQLWETKVMQSRATEGFFRHSHHSPQFTLQLPPNFHRLLQPSAAPLVIPTGRGVQHFMAADVGASRVGETLTLPSGVTYPVHVPAGVILQMASGQLFKVNVPIVVTQASGDANIPHHPVQQMLHPLGQPSVPQAGTASAAQVNASSGQAATETLQPQETAVQQTVVFQENAVERNLLESSTNTTPVQQPSVSQQQLAANAVSNQRAGSPEESQHEALHAAVCTPESSEGFSLAESLGNNSSDVLLDVKGKLDLEPEDLVQQEVSDDIIDLIIMGKGLGDGAVLNDHDGIASSDKVRP
ncbi:TF2AY factor, partial [Baryphthengus martii]|nr:TF2AY factor [Baryphthengus martii]